MAIGIIVKTLLGWILIGGLVIGGLALMSGDLRNSDDIGGSVGAVIGAGVFRGIFGDDGMISSALEQREPAPSSGRN